MGGNMFRLKDRFQGDLCLGMAHEEVVTATARGELRSYKQLRKSGIRTSSAMSRAPNRDCCACASSS